MDASAKTPILIKALQQISPIKLAIEALCIAEFKGMEFDDGKGRWRLSGWRLKDLPRMGGKHALTLDWSHMHLMIT